MKLDVKNVILNDNFQLSYKYMSLRLWGAHQHTVKMVQNIPRVTRERYQARTTFIVTALIRHYRFIGSEV